MLYTLKRHPFPVRAHFDFSLVLTYALPKEVLSAMLPAGLEPDTHHDHGFVAVAMVQTRNLRPYCMPAFAGRDFFLAGYRIFVKYHTQKGRRYRGLYILRSDTDSSLMQFAGNLLTHYNYHTVNVSLSKSAEGIAVSTSDPGGMSDARVAVRYGSEQSALPETSVFTSWKEARRFAGPLPFTFDHEKQTNSIIIIEGVRDNWEPQPVEVTYAHFGFFSQPVFAGCTPLLSNAFITSDIPYMWKSGVREKL